MKHPLHAKLYAYATRWILASYALICILLWVKPFYYDTLIYEMQYLRLHTGGAGKNAEFPSICVHVVVMFPFNSKPESQLKVAVSPTELPVKLTSPLSMSTGSGHSAAEQDWCKLCIKDEHPLHAKLYAYATRWNLCFNLYSSLGETLILV